MGKHKVFKRVLGSVVAMLVLLFFVRQCDQKKYDKAKIDPTERKEDLGELSIEEDSSNLEIGESGKRLSEDSSEWSLAQEENTIETYQKYLESFPDGIFTREAQQSIDDLEQLNIQIAEEKARQDRLVAAERAKAEEHRNQVITEIELNMERVQGGTFMMGCADYYRPPTWEDNKPHVHGADRFGPCAIVETPAHEVTLDSFYISKYEVTQAQWEMVMGHNPSRFDECPNCPVESVSWNEVQRFVSTLNELTGMKYRLPTEAEWEYAARGGNQGGDHDYAGSNDIDSVAWWIENSSRKTHPVGQKKPNGLGLYDMTGNVEEFCHDWYGMYYYRKSPAFNPKGPPAGTIHVRRGADFYTGRTWSRLTERELSKKHPKKSPRLGFRLAR